MPWRCGFSWSYAKSTGREKADALTRKIATRLPKDADVIDTKKYAAEYRKAWHDFKHE